MSEVTLNPPTRRECVRCGRVDTWDEKAMEWRIDDQDGQKQSGNVYCLHEWDIAGSHKPIREHP